MTAKPRTGTTEIDPARLPKHVAIIMDGNGRWAKRRLLPRQAGHRAGTENIRRIIKTFVEYGIPNLTLYAFSTENWSRPLPEVKALMSLVARSVDREVRALNEMGVRIVHIGRLDRMPPQTRAKVEQAIEITAHNNRITVALAFDYGGRDDILQAVRHIVEDGVAPEKINEALFASYLHTSDLPDPDLIIRTAGEMRLSNFLLWQAAYAEYYSTETLWPDFGPKELAVALEAYTSRERRFGGVTPPSSEE